MPNPASFRPQNNRTVPLDFRRLLRKESITTSASRQGNVSPSHVSAVLVSKKTAAQIWAITRPSAIRVQMVSIVRINPASPKNTRNLNNCFHRRGYSRWKHQSEYGSAFGPILAVDLPAMLADDPITSAESEPYSFSDWLGGVERLKNAPRLFQPGTRIHESDLDMLLHRSDSDDELPCFVSFHRINRIRDEMQENLNQLIRVTLNHRYSVLFLDLYSHAVSAPSTRQANGALQQRPDIKRRAMQRHLLREAEHVLHQAIRSPGGLADFCGHPLPVPISRGAGAKRLDVFSYRRHRAIDLMRHPRYELS